MPALPGGMIVYLGACSPIGAVPMRSYRCDTPHSTAVCSGQNLAAEKYLAHPRKVARGCRHWTRRWRRRWRRARGLKFFLHISKEEQKERLLERQEEAVKAWKLSVSDWEERQWWDDYQRAYEDALARCSTPAAPWMIVPADRKWFRNLAVAQAIVEALRPYQQEWMATLEQMSQTALAELRAMPEAMLR